MTTPTPAPAPGTLPPITGPRLLLRVVFLVAFWVAMMTVIKGAQHLRDTYIHEPVCTPVCAKRGMRFEGIRQHAKTDSAAACLCVSPTNDRAVVPTRFFSEIGVFDFFAREATSTLGVLTGCAFAGAGIFLLVLTIRGRRADAKALASQRDEAR